MLLSSKYEVKLAKSYLKVLYLSVAANDTFVFLGMSGVGKDVLVHCNSAGQILYEYQFSEGNPKNSVDTMGMLTDREAIVL
jgi:ABC-type taurine transport system ATPase subunit